MFQVVTVFETEVIKRSQKNSTKKIPNVLHEFCTGKTASGNALSMLEACLEKINFRNLQAPLCGIFYPHSAAVARYAASFG